MCMGAVDTMLRGLYHDNELPDEMAAVVMSADDISQQLMISSEAVDRREFWSMGGRTNFFRDKLPFTRESQVRALKRETYECIGSI